MKNKIKFFLPPIILAIVSLIWYFGEEGRWYDYRDEVMFMPLMILHFALPIFYLIALIVNIARPKERSEHKVFYIVSSIVLMIVTSFGLLIFGIMTSGA